MGVGIRCRKVLVAVGNRAEVREAVVAAAGNKEEAAAGVGNKKAEDLKAGSKEQVVMLEARKSSS